MWVLNFVNGFAPIEKAISQQFEALDIYIFIPGINFFTQKSAHQYVVYA